MTSPLLIYSLRSVLCSCSRAVSCTLPCIVYQSVVGYTAKVLTIVTDIAPFIPRSYKIAITRV